MTTRIEEIKRELKSMELVNDCSYNNDGLYNEMRILKDKLLKELKELMEDEDESKKNG